MFLVGLRRSLARAVFMTAYHEGTKTHEGHEELLIKNFACFVSS